MWWTWAFAALAAPLTVSAEADGQYELGAYKVVLTDRGLQVLHAGREVLDTPQRRAFVSAARDATTFHEHRGMISIDRDVSGACGRQTVSGATLADGVLTLSGTLDCGEALPFSLVFTEVERALGFTLTVQGAGNWLVALEVASTPTEDIFGFGEQFTHVNVKGKKLPIVVSEQGIGRGAQPITFGANLAAGAGGHWWTSYAGVPHFMTSRLRSVALENHEPSFFDMSVGSRIRMEVHASRMQGRIYAGDTPAALIEAHTALSGRQRPLPDWILEGAVIGMQGGTDTVRAKWETLQQAGVPIAAFWLQDWVGQRKTSFGKQLWWSWTLDEQRYPGWDGLVDELHARDIEVMVYVNPFLVDVSEREGEYRNLYAEAVEQDLLVTQDGAPYPLTNTSFDAGLLDLTKPAARAWMVELLRQEVMRTGAKGWMADFGEALPFDGELAEGSPRSVHNAYPEIWAQVNAEAIAGAEDAEDYVYFMRSAYTRSPGSTSLFWLGDQLVSWDRFDGIETAVAGLLSSGLSGFAYNHSDVGGYTTITSWLRNYHRSAELHQRWAELSAFNVVFRTHEGNQPDNNAQFDHDPDTLAHFAKMARSYACWADYRKALVAEASETGLPVVRHPWIHFPDEQGYRDLTAEQFLVGTELMVAPVTDKGARAVRVRFPANAGRWVHLYTGEAYGPGVHRVAAPLGQPAAFGREGSAVTETVRACLAEG